MNSVDVSVSEFDVYTFSFVGVVGRWCESSLLMMSRPILLVFLLIVLIITSQLEWKQQLVSDVEPSPSISQKQQQISNREEAVKEKVIMCSCFCCILCDSLELIV